MWTWNPTTHPQVEQVFTHPPHEFDWCDRLENSPVEFVVGKILCVCAGLEIASTVIDRQTPSKALDDARQALSILKAWIDDPTDERCFQIDSIIFPAEHSPDSDPEDVVWWALRTATSAVGCYEAAWALESTCDAALRAGQTPTELFECAKSAVLSRRSS